MEVVDERIGGNKNIKRGRDGDDDEKVGRLEKRPSGVVVLEEYSGDEMINGVKYEEEKKETTTHGHGGLFNQLITNLVNSPRPTKESDGEECSNDADADANANAGEVPLDNEKVDGDGNTIDNIVARLPRTLSEDTAPPTDEASILIHSIIHD